jgi:hypothetical protein
MCFWLELTPYLVGNHTIPSGLPLSVDSVSLQNNGKSAR